MTSLQTYDVTLTLPVTFRVRAGSKEQAEAMAAAISPGVALPKCVGFPLDVKAKEVKEEQDGEDR